MRKDFASEPRFFVILTAISPSEFNFQSVSTSNAFGSGDPTGRVRSGRVTIRLTRPDPRVKSGQKFYFYLLNQRKIRYSTLINQCNGSMCTQKHYLWGTTRSAIELDAQNGNIFSLYLCCKLSLSKSDLVSENRVGRVGSGRVGSEAASGRVRIFWPECITSFNQNRLKWKPFRNA